MDIETIYKYNKKIKSLKKYLDNNESLMKLISDIVIGKDKFSTNSDYIGEIFNMSPNNTNPYKYIIELNDENVTKLNDYLTKLYDETFNNNEDESNSSENNTSENIENEEGE